MRSNTPLPSQLYIGLMSGTSVDGVDAALLDFSDAKPRVCAVETAGIATELRAELLALNQAGGNELHRAALAGNALMRIYAQVVNRLLQSQQLSAKDIRAIGAHGQTVRHRPQQFDATGYTIQLCNGALLAELTGIDVVADFRSRDVAAGGQGAPLAPLFHRAWFAQENKTIGVLNIGGISNLSILRADGQTLGFDCGPGNALLDFWCEKHTGKSYDEAGAWGAGGQLNAALLERMLAEPYFALKPPKSTGRDLFNAAWLERFLVDFPAEKPQNVQKTLLELTVKSIGICGSSYEKESDDFLSEIIVCGGGAFNKALMKRLNEEFQGRVVSSAAQGLPPQDVEAAAFAWLAKQCVERVPLPVASVTGARGERVLGAIYPA